jgi:cyclopropane fatty-acyl-phospholipid synthase-like methyltransferase
MTAFQYTKSSKYTDLDTIYEQCSGPGGLQLAEFMAEKMGLKSGATLLDVGCNRGIQTCFLAKEFGVVAIGLDPWDDRKTGSPMVEHLRANTKLWGVENSVLGINLGVPDTHFASESFDFVYSTTALEMVRQSQGVEGYLNCLKEIHRLLKPGGVFGLGEPMHLDVSVPTDLLPYVSEDEYPWIECFRSLRETVEQVEAAGFAVSESEYAPDARKWWLSFAKHDPFCKEEPAKDPKTLEVDGGRWASFGYIIAVKSGSIG